RIRPRGVAAVIGGVAGGDAAEAIIRHLAHQAAGGAGLDDIAAQVIPGLVHEAVGRDGATVANSIGGRAEVAAEGVVVVGGLCAEVGGRGGIGHAGGAAPGVASAAVAATFERPAVVVQFRV